MKPLLSISPAVLALFLTACGGGGGGGNGNNGDGSNGDNGRNKVFDFSIGNASSIKRLALNSSGVIQQSYKNIEASFRLNSNGSEVINPNTPAPWDSGVCNKAAAYAAKEGISVSAVDVSYQISYDLSGETPVSGIWNQQLFFDAEGRAAYLNLCSYGEQIKGSASNKVARLNAELDHTVVIIDGAGNAKESDFLSTLIPGTEVLTAANTSQRTANYCSAGTRVCKPGGGCTQYPNVYGYPNLAAGLKPTISVDKATAKMALKTKTGYAGIVEINLANAQLSFVEINGSVLGDEFGPIYLDKDGNLIGVAYSGIRCNRYGGYSTVDLVKISPTGKLLDRVDFSRREWVDTNKSGSVFDYAVYRKLLEQGYTDDDFNSSSSTLPYSEYLSNIPSIFASRDYIDASDSSKLAAEFVSYNPATLFNLDDQYDRYDVVNIGVDDESGSGSCSGYPEILSQAEINAAQACGTQTYAQFQTAQIYYDATITTCEMGDTTSANTNYQSYRTTAQLARNTYNNLCK